jgi:PAS domain S-box-containing protein
MFDSIKDHAMLVVDAGGVIVRWDGGAEQVFGDAAPATGVSVAQLLDCTSEALAGRLDEARRNGVATWEGPCRRPDGTVFVGAATVRPIELDAERDSGFAVVIQDVSEPRDLRRRLQLSQKTEAVGRLAGGVAHDFNNLLTAILGSAESLEQDRTLTDASRRRVAEISRAAGHAADMTRQLMALGRRQATETTVIDLSSFLDGILPMFRRLIGEHIEIVSDACAVPLPVLSDRGHLEQIMLNLVVNARDAMPEGGRLTVRVRGEALADRSGADGPGPGEYVVLEVSDTGTGMDEATQAHAFEPFFTTRPGHGTGLGLATVNSLVAQMGGEVRLDSVPGRGTTFSLYFPKTDADVTAVDVDLPDDVAGGDETVLLVEDDSSVRALLERVLVGKGYHVLAAEHPAAALALVEEYDEPIDLIVTDLIMPGSNGIELVGMIDEVRPGLPVLYISGYANPVRSGALSETDHFLQKPFSSGALLSRIRRILSAPV